MKDPRDFIYGFLLILHHWMGITPRRLDVMNQFSQNFGFDSQLGLSYKSW